MVEDKITHIDNEDIRYFFLGITPKLETILIDTNNNDD